MGIESIKRTSPWIPTLTMPVPSGSQQSRLTRWSSCMVKVVSRAPSFIDQSRTVPSAPPVATIEPSGEISPQLA